MKYVIEEEFFRNLILEALTYQFDRIRNPAAIWQIASYVSGFLHDKIEPTNDLPENMSWRDIIEKSFFEAYTNNKGSVFGCSPDNEGISPKYNMAFEMEEILWKYRYIPVLFLQLTNFDQYQMDIKITE